MDEWHVVDPADWGDFVGVPDIPYIGYLQGNDDDDNDNNRPQQRPPQYMSKSDRLEREAWRLYMDFKDEEALKVIDQSLSLNPHSAKSWNTKAIILESLHRFEMSKRCYDKSLNLKKDPLVYDNKARMINKWSGELYDDDKDLEKGIWLLREAIAGISYPGCEEDTEKYQNSLDEFERRAREVNAQSRILKKYEDNILITITGTSFYNPPKFEKGMKFTLKKEPDNEHDKNAIAVYLKNKKVGYVSNSESTNADISIRAFFLKNLPDDSTAEFLFTYKHNYYIAAILKDD